MLLNYFILIAYAGPVTFEPSPGEIFLFYLMQLVIAVTIAKLILLFFGKKNRKASLLVVIIIILIVWLYYFLQQGFLKFF